MGSAFTPVQSSRAAAITRNKGDTRAGMRANKRARQVSSLHQMLHLDKVEEEEQTVETMPDHLSTSASEASSKASNTSQGPPLLDFIGNVCSSTAWFTSCFPCAVVDINDSDDYIVDKLSRESAMNVMYASSNMVPPSPQEAAPATDSSCTPERVIESKGSDQEKNLLYVRLPEQVQAMDIAPLHSMPSVIQECSDEESHEGMDEVSLNDDEAPQRYDFDSDVIDDTEYPEPDEMLNESGARNSPLKKKFSVKKMFGRKKKA